MRTCYKCKVEKDESEFHKKKGKKISYECIPCHRAYVREHYKNNKQYYIEKAVIQKQKIVEWFSDYKSKLKCEKCGESHPATFDFHHTDPSKKEDCISTIVARGNFTLLKTELPKCKVFCANCHRKLHWQQKQMRM